MEFFHKGSDGESTKHGGGDSMENSVTQQTHGWVHAVNPTADLLMGYGTIEKIAWRLTA